MKKEHVGGCRLNINMGLNHDMTPAECDCDGYHTFNELYDHRIFLFIALCKMISQEMEHDGIASLDLTYRAENVWRSRRHSDGELCFGGNDWFVMGIGTQAGEQITYHLPMGYWSFTDFAKDLENAPEFDGHTPQDVLDRLREL